MKINVGYILCLLLAMGLCLPIQAQEQLNVETTLPDWNFASLSCYETEAGCSYYGKADHDANLYFLIGAEKQLIIVKSDGSPAQHIDITMIYQEFEDDDGGDFIPFEDGTIVFARYRQDEDLRLFQYDIASETLTPINLSGSPRACHGLPRVSTPAIYRIGLGRSFLVCAVQDDHEVILIVNLDEKTDEIIVLEPYFEPEELDIEVQGGADGYVYIEAEVSVSLSDSNRFATLQRYEHDQDIWIDIPILKIWLPGFTDAADIRDTELMGIDETGHIYYSVDWEDEQSQLSLHVLKISSDGQLIGLIDQADMDFLPLFHTMLPGGAFVISNLPWSDSYSVMSFQGPQD